MMGTLLRLFFLASIGWVVSWGGFLLIPSVAGCFRVLDDGWFHHAFPQDSEVRGNEGLGGPRFPWSLLPSITKGQGALSQGGAMSQRHLQVAGGLLPFFTVLSLGSLLVGLILRERLRLGSAYASPTSGFLAKRLAEGVALALLLWMFSPVPAPYWTIYPLLLIGSVGLSVYVANLPLRL